MTAPDLTPLAFSPPRPALAPPTGKLSLLHPTVGVLIAEVAARLEPLADILKRHSVSKRQFAALMADSTFRAALKEQHRTFASIANLPERIRLKSQLLTEMLLDEMYNIVMTPSSAPSAKVQAFSQIKTLTGLERPESPLPQQKFSLTINVAPSQPALTLAGDTPVIDARPGQPGYNGQAVVDEIEDAVSDAAEAVQEELRGGAYTAPSAAYTPAEITGWNVGTTQSVDTIVEAPKPWLVQRTVEIVPRSKGAEERSDDAVATIAANYNPTAHQSAVGRATDNRLSVSVGR